jgi:ribonuclease P protein component
LYHLPIAQGTSTQRLKQVEVSAVTKFGISVSQKVSKKAVIRNRLKRQIRAALRSLFPQIMPGWLVVISLSTAASGCNYYDFLRELEQLLAQAEVIDGHS